jgi:hypothetical protein
MLRMWSHAQAWQAQPQQDMHTSLLGMQPGYEVALYASKLGQLHSIQVIEIVVSSQECIEGSRQDCTFPPMQSKNAAQAMAASATRLS